LHDECIGGIAMTATYVWAESYRAAVLETDWTKMEARIQAAESKMLQRQRILSEPASAESAESMERLAAAQALAGLRTVREEAGTWQRVPGLSQSAGSASSG